MNSTTQRDGEIEIDLKEILVYLLGKAGYIIGSGVVLAVIAMAVTTFFITPKYTSTTSMYVLNRQTNESITSSDIQSSTYLTNDYMALSKSRTVIEAVIANLDLDKTYEQVLGAMSVSTASDTRIVSISYTDVDPYQARDVANAIRTVAASHIQAVMNTEAVNVVDEANIPTSQSSPNFKKNVALAGLIGIFLAAAFYIVLFLVNDKITTTEDIERYLGLSILGSLPLEKEEVRQKKARKRQRAKQNIKHRTTSGR